MVVQNTTGFPQDRRMKRLYDPVERVYLHQSGRGTTRDEMWAWFGFEHQAANLKQRALARGEEWPFELRAPIYNGAPPMVPG